MDEAAAFDWSVARYLNRPERNRQLLGFQGDIGSNSPIMADYFVATATFCYFLHTESKADSDPADAHFDVLSDPKNYPPGVPHVGPVEGAHVIQRIQKRGHLPVCGFLANASVTSSIPLDRNALAPARLAPKRLQNDALYLAWEVHDDGDALDVVGLTMYGALRLDPAFGSFPAGVRVNPYLIDLHPPLFAWYAQRPQIQVVASMTDGGASYTVEGQQAWTRTYRHYLAAANGSIGILNFFGSAKQKFIEPLGVPFVISGYMGEPKQPEWGLLGNKTQTVWCTIVGPQRNGDLDVIEPLKEAVRQADQPGKPLFILARSKALPSVLYRQLTARPREIAPGRTMILLSPGDLAATYRAWATQ